MRLLTARSILAFVLIGLYCTYALVAWGLRAMGGPVLPMPGTRPSPAQVAEQRAIHADFDRLDAIERCLVAGEPLVDAIRRTDAALAEAEANGIESVRVTRVPSPSCAFERTAGGVSAWSDVIAAGARFDTAAYGASSAMSDLEREVGRPDAHLVAVLEAYDTAASEVLAAHDALADAEDFHTAAAFQRGADLLAPVWGREQDARVLRVSAAGIRVGPALRRLPEDLDLAEIARVRRALETAAAALPSTPHAATLQTRSSELATALEALEKSPGAEALDAAFTARNAFIAASNAILPSV